MLHSFLYCNDLCMFRLNLSLCKSNVFATSLVSSIMNYCNLLVCNIVIRMLQNFITCNLFAICSYTVSSNLSLSNTAILFNWRYVILTNTCNRTLQAISQCTFTNATEIMLINCSFLQTKARQIQTSSHIFKANIGSIKKKFPPRCWTCYLNSLTNNVKSPKTCQYHPFTRFISSLMS